MCDVNRANRGSLNQVIQYWHGNPVLKIGLDNMTKHKYDKTTAYTPVDLPDGKHQRPRRVVSELPANAKQVPFADTGTYVTDTGDFYVSYYKGRYLKLRTNTVHGYAYCSIKVNGKKTSFRAHRVVAKTWLPNPDPAKYTIVMHIDNNKQNNNVANLRWGTISENTKQAFDDGLAKNAIGYEDSQSFPVIMYDRITGKEVARYGSIKSAARETNMSPTTIARQCKADPTVKFRKPYYFKYDPDFVKSNQS